MHAGGLVKVAATFTNTGPNELRHVTLHLQLPDYLVPKHTSTWPPLKQSPNLPLVEDARDLYWTDLTLAPGKRRRVCIKALVPRCQNTTTTTPLAIQASAYLMTNDNVTGQTEARPASFRVRPALKPEDFLSLKACTPLPPPQPIPDDAGYTFYANNQKCKDAILSPLRRLAMSSVAARENGEGGKPEGATASTDHRGLSPTTSPTAEECTYVADTRGGGEWGDGVYRIGNVS